MRVQKEERKGRVEEGERVEWRGGGGGGGGDEAPVSPPYPSPPNNESRTAAMTLPLQNPMPRPPS
jgi:hypothetical protein